MGDEGWNISSQNSEFFQNSDMKGYIANIQFLGNVFVLTQAKIYSQYSEFLQKIWGGGLPKCFNAKIENSYKISQAIKKCESGGHLLQNSPILM